MKDSLYTLVFAALLGIVCATALTAARHLTSRRYEENRRADELLNILAALEPSYDRSASAEQVLSDFETMAPNGAETMGELTVYRYLRRGRLKALAARFDGEGLWGPIEGYLVLESDLTTVRALAITRQEETPGLGGEIVSEKFRGQWKGKRIVSADGSTGIVVRMSGPASGINEVHGVTGATLTSRALEGMVNDVIVKIIEERTRRE